MTAPVADDVPPPGGKLSPALLARLHIFDLIDIKPVLRSKSVRTLQVLKSLDDNDWAVLLIKVRQQWEILGKYEGNLNERMSNLYEAPTTGSLAFTGSLATAYHNSATASSNRGCNGGSSSSSSSSNNSRVVAPAERAVWPGLVNAGAAATPGLVPAMPAGLPQPSPDDTALMKSLPGALGGALPVIGRECYNEALRHFHRSNQFGMASYLAAAEALAALSVAKELVGDRERKEALKAAKKAARDFVVWRSCGYSGGLDSKEALVHCFERAYRHAPGCDENTVSQLTNGFTRVRQELSGIGPRPRLAGSPSRNQGHDARAAGSAQGGRSRAQSL
jgi:hypothetical protein